MCIGNHGGKPADVRELIGRRGFLRAGAAAALLGATAVALPHEAAEASRRRKHRVPPEAISIQLYTLREKMDANLDAVFKGLARIGYRKVEQAGFHNRTAREFKAALDKYGLRATSGHQSVFPYEATKWRASIEDAVILGQRYMVEPLPLFIASGLVTPVVPPSTAWGQYAEQLNQAAEQASYYGLKVGYHNHNPEFLPLPDDPKRTGYDVLMAETDPKLVHFELDVYWSWYAGKDPVKLLYKHPKRFRQLHIKDMDKDGSITAPGTGVIDFTRILRAAEKVGIKEYIIEQDNAGQNAMKSARLGYQLLRDTRW